jgi:hypothetical protein
MAIANGMIRGRGAQFERISFRYPPALYEGPFDVLHWVYKAMGNEKAAAEALRDYQLAKRARESAKST